jgi:hypothetical protein
MDDTPQDLESVISRTALPQLQQYNALQAKEPITSFTITNQLRIAMPKDGESTDQSCFEQLWVATARDQSTLQDWRPVQTLEEKIASQGSST